MIMKKDLILFLGQSNMQGQTEKLSETAQVENALEYKFLTDTLEPLKNPVGETITFDMKAGFDFTDMNMQGEWLKAHVLGKSAYGNTNMVPEFCRAYIKESGRSVVAVHAAKGSTDISFWLNAGYDAIVKKTMAAIDKVRKENIGGIYCVWLQGESDALKGTEKSAYKSALITLKDNLKRDIGIERFGIIKVGAFAMDKRDQEIFSAQEEACAEDKDFIMLTRITEKLVYDQKFLNSDAFGHYGSYGQEVLGRSAGKNLARAVNGKEFDTEEIIL